MYETFYGLQEAPFSIAPDPRYLYMSQRHREALAHLLFSLQREEGGFVLLTGEVGTGKTTICRSFLEKVPERTDVAFIVHPRLTARELLATICDELGIHYPSGSSIKILVDELNHHLLDRHATGRHTVIIIDEAQNLSIDVLEQLRLLTNLETSSKKLIQIILLGQPELRDILQREELRQLSQRITARYHLEALNLNDLHGYLRYRLSVAGLRETMFTDKAVKTLFKLSKGIPRLVNLICDRALLGAYSMNEPKVGPEYIKSAAKEIGLFERKRQRTGQVGEQWWYRGSLIGLAAGFFVLALIMIQGPPEKIPDPAVAVPGAIPDMLRMGEAGGTPASTNKDSVVTTDPEVMASAAEVESFEEPAPEPLRPVLAPPIVIGEYEPAEDNKLRAYSALLAAWRIDETPPRGELVCDFVGRYGLACLHREGNWRSLLRLDRPAVLRLRNDKGELFFLTLVGYDASNDSVSVVLDNEVFDLRQEAIDRYWDGVYSIVWKQPPYMSMTPAMAGYEDETSWLDRTLKLAYERYRQDTPEPAMSSVEFATLDLKGKVVWFQRQAGILADGLPGAITLIMLNNWTGSDAPRLVYDPEPVALQQH
ncbi:ExeA family protein [Allohahella marinimesophila]|uniref:ExeA family protein n=1 Tax=Allohahella marinimesophila TaxID=1054972 RepID=A0ABP7PEI6_9GAMM